MRDDVRVYGDFHRLPPESFDKIKDSIPFDQVDYNGDVLRVDHEGMFLDVDDFLEEIATLLGPGGYGSLDYIDHVEWEVTRYTIKDGQIKSKVIPADNVLDAHQREHGL